MTRLTDTQKRQIVKLSNDKMKPKDIAELMGLDVKTVNYVKWSEKKLANGEKPFKKKSKKPRKARATRAAKEAVEEVLEEVLPDAEVETESTEGACEKRFGALLWAFSEAMFTLLDAGFEVKFEKPSL